MVKMENFMLCDPDTHTHKDTVFALKVITEFHEGNTEFAHLFIWQFLINGMPIMPRPCVGPGEKPVSKTRHSQSLLELTAHDQAGMCTCPARLPHVAVLLK